MGEKLNGYEGELRYSDGVLRVDLSYPSMQEGGPGQKSVEINLVHVRASDGLRVSYDFSRDGWIVSQPKRGAWSADEPIDEQWAEVGFFKSWAINVDDAMRVE